MKVSVIIPVYNAASYVGQAVESALAQSETAEVILIEDGSKDDSLAVCMMLAEKFDGVRLLRHQGGKNRGAGASRNLGIKHSHYDYVAFLDADDYYLPTRFLRAKQIFMSDPVCDGVYEALGITFEDIQVRANWLASNMGTGLTTMTLEVPPDELFEKLIAGKSGYFSLDCLVIKRSILAISGLMNEKLLLHQDSDFILRLAVVARLMPGRLNDPVAIRRVHGNNRISAPLSHNKIYKNRIKMWKATFGWLREHKHFTKSKIIFDHMLQYCMNCKPLLWPIGNKFPTEIRQFIRLVFFSFEYPKIVLIFDYWKTLFSIPVWVVIKRNFRKILKLDLENKTYIDKV